MNDKFFEKLTENVIRRKQSPRKVEESINAIADIYQETCEDADSDKIEMLKNILLMSAQEKKSLWRSCAKTNFCECIMI